MEEHRLHLLHQIPLFSALSRDELAKLAPVLVEKKFAKGEMVFFAKEPGETLYVILEGLIKIFCVSDDGREKTLGLLEKGDYFGEMALLDDTGRSANAEVLEDARLLTLYKKDFSKLVNQYPNISHRIIYILVQRLREADTQIEELSFKNVHQRVARLLLRLARKYGHVDGGAHVFHLKLNREELGNLAGCSREAVSRAINTFQRKGWIKEAGGRLEVQVEALEEAVPTL